MARRSGPRNLLAGRYGLGEMKSRKTKGLSPTVVDLSLVGSGLVLGLATWPYQNTPIGQTLLIAGGGLAAVGLAFLIRDLVTSKPVVSALGA